MLEDPISLCDQRTKERGLIKGESACNRSACQEPLDMRDGGRWWNTETQAYYCKHCARRINQSSVQSLGKAICITESDKWQLDMDPLLKAAVKRLTKPLQ